MKAAAEELQCARLHPVRRLLHRSVRRPHAGHHRHDGQPALSQRRRDGAAPADPLAADAAGRARRRHLRQGTAGDDDGPGGDARSALRAGARRRDAAADGGRGRRQGADHRRPLRARAKSRLRAGGGAGLPRLRLARRRLPVSRHGGDVAGRRRSAGPVAAARRAGAVGPADLARHGPPLRPRRGPFAARRIATTPHSHRRRRAQRDGRSMRPSAARRICCCTSPPSPTTPGLRRPTVEDWIAVNRQRAAPGRCAAERPGRPSDGARLPGRRRARGDAAPAPARLARCQLPDRHRRTARPRARLVGAIRATPAPARRAAPQGRHRSRQRHHELRSRRGSAA